MTDIIKLIKLIDEAADIIAYQSAGQMSYYLDSEKIAEHLLTNGVTIKDPNRPLTLEEVKDYLSEGEYSRPLWIEDNEEPTNTGWDTSGAVWYWLNKAVNKDELVSGYGKEWCCWAEKPTDKEREMAKWE